MDEKKILIVEDDEGIRETLADILEDESYVVFQADHGRAALDLLQSGTSPDLLLIDLMMPVMSGWQLLDALKQEPQLESIPVLVFSAAQEVGSLHGAREVLRKPVDLEQLLDAIQRHAHAPRT